MNQWCSWGLWIQDIDEENIWYFRYTYNVSITSHFWNPTLWISLEKLVLSKEVWLLNSCAHAHHMTMGWLGLLPEWGMQLACLVWLACCTLSDNGPSGPCACRGPGGPWWALVGLDGPILCEALRSGGNTTFCNWLLDASITLITPCVTVIQIIVARSCLLVVRKMEIPPFVILTSGDFWQRHLFCEFC